MTDQPPSNELSGASRYRWYLPLPLIWVAIALCRLAGDGWVFVGYVLVIVGLVLVGTRAMNGPSGLPVLRTDAERRLLRGGLVAMLLSVLLAPGVLCAAYQVTVMERRDAGVVTVYPDGYHWSGRNHETKYDNVVLDLGNGSEATIQTPSRIGIATGDLLTVWIDPSGFAAARPGPGAVGTTIGALVSLLALLDLWARRRHRALFGLLTPDTRRAQLAREQRLTERAVAAEHETASEKDRSSLRSVRRVCWVVSGISAASFGVMFLLAARDPSWHALSPLFGTVGGVLLTVLSLLAVSTTRQSTTGRRTTGQGTKQSSGFLVVSGFLLLVGVDVAGYLFLAWVGADLVVQARVSAEPVTVTQVQDREDTSYAVRQRSSGSVISFRRADGSVWARPLLSDRSPVATVVGDVLSVRVPAWHWVGVRSRDAGAPEWARVTAGVLGVLLVGQVAATVLGYRRVFHDLTVRDD